MARARRVFRRAVLVGVLALAVVLGLRLPAEAGFASSAPLPQTTLWTATIAPPTNIAALLNSCSNARWMSVTVSWTASPSSRVSGYSINAYRSDGSVTTVAQTDAATTAATVTVDKLSTGATTVVFTVTTMTDVGWTAESVRSGPLSC